MDDILDEQLKMARIFKSLYIVLFYELLAMWVNYLIKIPLSRMFVLFYELW
jgi:hypothetical protein